MIYYGIRYDADFECVIVIFGSEEEIEDDDLSGGFQYADPHGLEKVGELARAIGDTGESCEDYILTSRYGEDQLLEVKEIVESEGFVEDPRILECGWG